jgi:hypothetical protein
VNTENEKAVRTLFEQAHSRASKFAVYELCFEDGHYLNPFIQAKWNGFRMALQSQVSNTSQDGSSEATRHATALEQCAIFAADVGDNIAKAMTDAAAYLRTVSTPPQQQEQSGEAVAWIGEQDIITQDKARSDYWKLQGWKCIPLYLAPPTSTAIAAMVIKQAAGVCHQYFGTEYPELAQDIHDEILSITPANAEAELEALKYDACINVAAELANEYGLPFGDSGKISAIVRRVLDEKGE